MTTVLLKITPVILLFFTGILFRKTGITDRKGAETLMKLVFHLAFPALILNSVTSINLNGKLLALPLISMFTIFLTFAIAFPVGRSLKLERKTLGVFLAGTMIMNNGFILPFIIASYGHEGLARLSMLDFGNAITVFTFVYFITCRYGENSITGKFMILKLVKSPPIWALVTALTLNLSGTVLPEPVRNFCSMAGTMAIPMVMISLGILFNLKPVKPLAMAILILIRVIMGFIIGSVIAYALDFRGIDRDILLIVASSPAGYNTLVFSTLEKLDTEFASAAVSYSIVMAMIYVPALILLFHW